MSVPAEQLKLRPSARRKAAIRRATRASRSALRQMDAEGKKELAAVYRRTAENIENRIRDAAQTGSSLVHRNSLRVLRDQIDNEIDILASEREQIFERDVRRAASDATAMYEPELGGQLQGINEAAVRFVLNQAHEDGLQLSDRFWDIDNQAKQRLNSAIAQAVVSGDSADKAARDFLERGEAVPTEVQRKIRDADAEQMAKRVGRELITVDGNSLGRTQMVFRTEIARAHGEAYRAASFEVPGVVGMRFELSPNHPEADICDMHASVNRYGLGRGVYPQDRSPWPAHPNTFSFETPVFEDEVTAEDRASKQTRIEWLKEQTPAVQKSVLGHRAKVVALQKDLLHEGQIATPWKVLKKRYAAKGVDMGQFKPRPTVSPLQSIVDDGIQPDKIRPWSRQSPGTKWHDEAFIDSPDYIREAVAKHDRLTGIIPEQANGAYYLGNRIHMAKYSPSSPEGQLVWRHEFGHHMDDVLGDGSNDWSSLTDNKNLLFAESRRVVKNADAASDVLALEYTEFSRLPQKQQRSWVDKKLADVGLDADALRREYRRVWGDAADQSNGSYSIIDINLLNAALAVEHKDARLLINGGLPRETNGNESLTIADYFGAMTLNRVGHGHTDGYYKKSSHRRPNEAFANAVALLGHPDQVWADLVRKIAPDFINAVEKELKK